MMRIMVSGNIKILQTVESNTAMFNFLPKKDARILLERPLLDLKLYGPKTLLPRLKNVCL